MIPDSTPAHESKLELINNSSLIDSPSKTWEGNSFNNPLIRPIFFLDVDGVFNCQVFYDKHYTHLERFDNIPFYKTVKKYLRKIYKVKRKTRDSEIEDLEYYKSNMCSDRLNMISVLIKEVNGEVVISASMRSGKSIEQLQKIFDYCGGSFTIIGKTEHLGYERGIEISKWLKDNITLEKHGCHYYDFYKYIIIDDDSDMLLKQQFNFFQVDNYSGLTPNTCYKIKRFLLHKTF